MDGWPEWVDLGGHPAEQAAGERAEGSSEPLGPAEYRCQVRRTTICGRCDAPDLCCYCAADVARLRRFATRMAMIHQPTGTPVCGCGTHACYVRTRLDDIAGPFGRPPRGPAGPAAPGGAGGAG